MYRTSSPINSIFAKTVIENQEDWCEFVPYVTFCYNTAYHTSTTFSPFYLMFFREPILGIALMTDKPLPEVPTNLDDFTEMMAEHMHAAYAVVPERLICAFSRAKQRYDERFKSMTFGEGQYVWYYSPRRRPGRGRKWQLLTSGSLQNNKKVNRSELCAAEIKAFIVHVDQLKIFEGDSPKCWSSAEHENGEEVAATESSMLQRQTITGAESSGKDPNRKTGATTREQAAITTSGVSPPSQEHSAARAVDLPIARSIAY